MVNKGQHYHRLTFITIYCVPLINESAVTVLVLVSWGFPPPPSHRAHLNNLVPGRSLYVNEMEWKERDEEKNYWNWKLSYLENVWSSNSCGGGHMKIWL